MNRMFTRIMTVVLAAIILLTASLSVISFFAMRSQRINARLEYLSREAEDIAYLAADYLSASVSDLFFTTDAKKYLNWKAQQVYDEFGAYIAVVDRWGNRMDNLRTAWSEDPDFVESLSGEAISQALRDILAGQTIRVQSTVGGNPTFTVGVPFMRYGSVAGAVLIQTRAQYIENGMEDLIGTVLAAALGVLVLSGAAVGLYVRSLTKPLSELTAAATAMADGDFSVPVDENRGDREVRQLSQVFNKMRSKLGQVEESRREFVANVSHELRSPITSIRGFAEGMADGVIPQEEHPRYLRLVAEESRRLSSLVGELLELSRLEREDAKADLSDFDLHEMLRRAIIRRINDLDEKNIETVCDFCSEEEEKREAGQAHREEESGSGQSDAEEKQETGLAEKPCMVRADSDRIEEVIINLLDNAIRFTPEDGKIILATRMLKDEVEVTIWDSGPAVPEEDRDRIFERFFTSDRAHTSGKGTGLGLSICQRALAMHGKEIRLLSDRETAEYGSPEGEGTAFRFTLDTAK